MTQVDFSDYKSLYLQTAKEYLEKMQSDLDKLSNDLSDKIALKDLYISSHSLKSQSQIMKFTDISDLSLDIETASKDALESNAKLSSQAILDIKKSVEILKELIHDVESGRVKYENSNGQT